MHSSRKTQAPGHILAGVFLNLPGERRGAHWAPRSDSFTRFRLGKPKNLWIALPKNLEKASKRAFRDSKKNAPS